MTETTTTDADDGNDNGRRKAIRTAAVVILLAVLCVSVVVAQSSTVDESDDFEDGNIDGWNGPGSSVSTTSTEGQYSLEQTDGYDIGGSPTPVQWTEGPALALDEEFTLRGTSYSSQGQGGLRTRVGLINDNDEGAMLVFAGDEGQTILTDDGDDYDPSTAPSLPQDYDSTWVSWEIQSPGNGTLNAKVWEVGSSEPSEYQMSREFEAVSSEVGINAGNTDEGDRYVLLDSVSVEGTLATGDPSLNIDTPNLIEHGSTRTYDVEELRPQPGGINSSVDVTENATVTSSNPDVLSVDSENNTLTATEDTSVAEIVRVQATYNNLTAYKEVTVAEPTVENLQILPGIWRFTALVGDTTIQVILLGTLMGIVGTRGASSFAGISLMEMTMVMGFLGGWVGLGIVLASTFVAVFIGLNLAANIDYSVRR